MKVTAERVASALTDGPQVLRGLPLLLKVHSGAIRQFPVANFFSVQRVESSSDSVLKSLQFILPWRS